MMAAPRLPTVGMKSSFSQDSSLPAASHASEPPTLALNTSGYIDGEWLPHTARLVTSPTGAPAFLASWVMARFWSRRVMAVKRSAGTPSAFCWAISALVLAGLPTTSTFRSSAAPAARASPWGLKMPPLASSRSARSMPLVRGRAPTSRADVDAVERGLGVVGDVDAGQQREGGVVQLHRGALGGLDGVGDLQQRQVDGGVGAQQLAGGDAEEQGVADLAGGAGDGYSYGRCHGKVGSSVGSCPRRSYASPSSAAFSVCAGAHRGDDRVGVRVEVAADVDGLALDAVQLLDDLSSSAAAGAPRAARTPRPARRRRSARPARPPSRAPGRSGCRGCPARRPCATGERPSSSSLPVARSSASPSTAARGVVRLVGQELERRGQRQELAERVPAQVVLLDELLHVLGRRAAGAGLEQAARRSISGTIESIFALVPSSRIGNRSVR